MHPIDKKIRLHMRIINYTFKSALGIYTTRLIGYVWYFTARSIMFWSLLKIIGRLKKTNIGCMSYLTDKPPSLSPPLPLVPLQNFVTNTSALQLLSFGFKMTSTTSLLELIKLKENFRLCLHHKLN